MNERRSNPFEEASESIPTHEEVIAVVEELLEGLAYKEVRMLEDEQGVYLLDCRVEGEDGYTEYLYLREGRYPDHEEASETAIHATYFDVEDNPVGGTSVAKYRKGEWVLGA